MHIHYVPGNVPDDGVKLFMVRSGRHLQHNVEAEWYRREKDV